MTGLKDREYNGKERGEGSQQCIAVSILSLAPLRNQGGSADAAKSRFSIGNSNA